MIVIDGAFGEGGGQILRTSLALSLIKGKTIRIDNIRAKRKNPGLQRQHLAAVHAAAELCNARVEGAEIGSKELTFRPSKVQAGEYRFATGSAGSTTLVLQTILPPLMMAEQKSTIHLEGGTHNPLAPPFDFLEKTFLPLIHRIGPDVNISLQRHGFYPAGGGELTVDITPANLQPQHWMERGSVRKIRARSLIARLPKSIAERELTVIQNRLNLHPDDLHVEEISNSTGPGNVVLIEMICENVTEVIVSFGGRGIRAEQVAEQAAAEFERYASADVFAAEHLADQLLLPLALAGGGSFSTLPLSGHSITNIEVIKRFIPIEANIESMAQNKICVNLFRSV